jgi:hypothetical protein
MEFIGIENNNFTYQTMVDYVNNLGTYWIKLIEQMIPATTIWNSGVKYENSIFHRQKFVWRRQFGCRIVPVPCKPCRLVGQILPYNCPVQTITCPIYPWDSNPQIVSFGGVLTATLNNYLTNNGLTMNDCDMNSLITNWFVDLRMNGTVLASDEFYVGVGINNPVLSSPSNDIWLTALENSLNNLQSEDLTYTLNGDNTVTINTSNCIPLNVNQTFEINVGINFNLICN